MLFRSKNIAGKEEARLKVIAKSEPDPNADLWKYEIAKAHAMFLAKASNLELHANKDDINKGPLQYELYSTAFPGNFLLKEMYPLQEAKPRNKARMEHDNELANGSVNGWAKFKLGEFQGLAVGGVAKKLKTQEDIFEELSDEATKLKAQVDIFFRELSDHKETTRLWPLG